MAEPRDATVIHVATGAPYDVLVGDALVGRLPDLLGERVQRVGLVFAEDLPDLPAPVRALLARHYDVLDLPAAARRGGQDRGRGRPLLGGARPGRLHPVRRGRHRRRGSDDRPRRFRRRHLAARRPRGARADHAARHGRRRGRRQDRHQHGRRQEPGRCLPRAGRRAVRPEPARHPPCRAELRLRAGRGRQVRLHRRPRDPAAGRGARRRARRARCCGSSSSVRSASRPTSSPATSTRPGAAPSTPAARCSTTVTPWGTRSSWRAATPCVTARPSRSAASTSPSSRGAAGVLDDAVADRHRTALATVGLPTGWSGASYDDLRARMAVDKKSRGSELRFVVLSDLAEPRILAAPREDDLRTAYDVMTGARP